MQVLIPQKLTILNNSVPENEASAWDASKSYVTGARVIYQHYVYQAVADNTNAPPASNCDFESAVWRTERITNKYACLDIYSHTQTVGKNGAPLSIQVPIRPPASGIALLNMTAVRVTVSVHTAAGELVYGGNTVELLQDSRHWWDYWFGPFRFQRDLVLTGIPPVTGTVTITLEPGVAAAVGVILLGEHVEFGQTQYGARSGFIDYSQNSTDAFGNEIWVKRHTARRATFTAYLERERLDYIQETLRNISGNPALWIGDNGVGYGSLVVYGFLREYEASLDDWGRTTGTFEIRGII